MGASLPAYEPEGCHYQHGSRVAYTGLTRALRHTRPFVDKPKVVRLWRCAVTRKKAHALHSFAHQLWEWRHTEPHRSWIGFHRHPMPWCTWGPESGGDYRARNTTSTAGGKFQILDSTWYANGGSHYPDSHPAAVAPPLEQERVARNVLASSGTGAWVGC